MVDITRLDETFLRVQFRVSRKQQLNFLEVLLRLVTDGIQPSRVCEHIRDIGLPTDRVAADAILHGLDEGRTVADAMVRVFQADIAAAMSAAEQSGGLAANGMAVLQRLQDQRDAKKGVYAQLSWPGLYLLFACALYVGFAVRVWPEFEAVAPLEDYALVSQRIGLFVLAWWPVILALVVFVPVLTRFLLRSYAGAGRRLLDRIWPFSLYRDVLGANALDDLGTLMAAGQEPRMAIETVRHGASPYARMYFDTMQRRLDEGYNISEILDVGLIARRYLAHLRLLAEHRNLRETMAATGASARNQALLRIKSTARVLNILGLAVVAISFAMLITGVYVGAQNVQVQADATFAQ